MSASASLIPELEDVIQHGTQEKRALTVQRIANLFIDGATHFNEDHIGLFDDVLCRLVTEIEAKARAEMANSLAPVSNAPAGLMRHLARDDDIAVAGPVLKVSARLDETDLVEVAKTKGQAHLAAIAGRTGIGEAVTDVLVRRGDPEVVRNVAYNVSARLSEGGFSALVRRAEGDDDLAERVGQRADIPPHLFRDLLVRATTVVQQRLLAQARPETQMEIQRVLDKIAREFGKSTPARDYAVALRAVRDLQKAGKLGENELAEYAKDRKYEDMVAALSVLCGVPIETTDRLMAGDRPDPILILCKSAGFGWATARSIIMARPSAKGTSNQSLDAAFFNFEKLSPSTAQRVVRFWQVRTPDDLPV
ncbi:MAG: DUF2336 domain-containing protein [Alphaproteobacteria bacterium]|nr:DUF2336 domain-containing protein [Alphaproteobacteria bacterium]